MNIILRKDIMGVKGAGGGVEKQHLLLLDLLTDFGIGFCNESSAKS